MSNSFFIYIDSEDRTSGVSNSFSVQLSDFNLKQGASVHVSLHECSFLNCEYPINSNNNTITFYEASSTATLYTATIAEGNYSSTTFPTALKSALESASGNAYTYTVSIASATDKLTISTTLPAVFQLVSVPSWTGLSSGTSFAATTTGTYPLNLSGIEYVDLLCPTLINDNINIGVNTNSILKRIPITVPYGSLSFYQSQGEDESVAVDPLRLNNLRFELRRPTGELYDLNGQRLSVVLKCTSVY